jgi:hypothetical protein
LTAYLLVGIGPKLVAVLAFMALGALAAKRRAPSTPVLLLFLAGLAARLLLAPKGVRVFYDEYEHLDLAWNLASRGVFAGTMAWIPERLNVDFAPLWPPLAHLHYAALFLARGFSEISIYGLNAVLSALTVLLAGGPVSAALLAFSSVSIMYSGTADLASVSLLWSALAWLAVLRAEKEGGAVSLWTAGLTLAAAIHARPDGWLLLPPALWLLLSRRGRAAAGPAALAVLSSLPLLLLVWNARAAGHDGYGDPWTSLLARIPAQAAENAAFFLEPPRLILFGLGAYGLWRRRAERPAQALALSALLYFLLYAAYPTSAFARGSGDKYALAMELPLALLASGAAVPGVSALLVLYAALGLASLRPGRDAGYAASDAFLRGLSKKIDMSSTAAGGPPLLTFVPPAPRVVHGAAVVHPVLLLEKGPNTLDPDGKGFLVLRDESWERRPETAARVNALIKTLYTEEEVYAEEAGGRRRLLTRLTPRN